MEINTINYRIEGMGRLENIRKNFNPTESVVKIINSVIAAESKLESVLIEISKEKFIINIVGKKLKYRYKFAEVINLNQNELVVALCSMTDKVKIKVEPGFESGIDISCNEIDTGKMESSIDNSYINCNDFFNKIEFIILTKDISAKFNELINKILSNKSSARNSFYNYLSDIYTDLIINDKTGIYVKINSDKSNKRINKKNMEEKLKKIEVKTIEGNIVNKEDNKVSDRLKIELYKMKDNKKGVELIVNNIKMICVNFNNILNWNAEPLRQEGYEFKRLYIKIFINGLNIDLNDYNKINGLITDNLINEMYEEVECYKYNFLNKFVNIKLEYERNKMTRFYEEYGDIGASPVTKKILDEHYSNLDK